MVREAASQGRRIGPGDLGVGSDVLEDLFRTAIAVSPSADRLLRQRLPEAARMARAVSGHWEFAAPARTVDSCLGLGGDDPVTVGLRRAAVARIALDHFELASPLPESVLALFPEHFAQLARFLTGDRAHCYINDYYVKDIRYALGVTIPCGALQMDLAYRIGPKLMLRDAFSTRSLRRFASYVACGGWRRWGNDHIDLRAMKEFHVAGWTASLARMADVLEMQTALRGVAGVSWFYDPALARISPSLAHLHRIPLRHGAFLVRMNTTVEDIRNATIRSPARRMLYENGEYRPARYLLAWPRQPLIAWAKRLGSDALRPPGSVAHHGAPAEEPLHACRAN